MNREQELKKKIAESKIELEKIKGKKILLCGYCYHKDEGDRAIHMRNSPHCHDMAYPCPLKVYERGVTFDEDGRANINWDQQ